MYFISAIKKGFIVLAIYFVVAFLILMAADRVQRLEERGFSSNNCGVSIKIGK